VIKFPPEHQPTRNESQGKTHWIKKKEKRPLGTEMKNQERTRPSKQESALRRKKKEGEFYIISGNLREGGLAQPYVRGREKML